MNEHSELSSIFCQVHHSWQLCLSPISDIIQPLPSLPALPAGLRHWLSNRLHNRFDNRYDSRVERTATVRSTGCQTGLYNPFDNRLYRVNEA